MAYGDSKTEENELFSQACEGMDLGQQDSLLLVRDTIGMVSAKVKGLPFFINMVLVYKRAHAFMLVTFYSLSGRMSIKTPDTQTGWVRFFATPSLDNRFS